MKSLFAILFLLFGFCVCNAQTDTLKASKQLREAPDDLKQLIKELTEEKAEKVSKDADLEIDGLLFDETKTKSGRDFYDLFFRDWEAPANSKNYSIFITEKPYRLTTTQIQIKINETLVFQSFLQPRGDIVEALAQQAVSQTQLYLQNYEAILKQLEGDDRSGSGIF
ncbi:CsgE family curli-type amyloid fiber assembly protein [Draconibacterium sp. IB214405]|uniref:CsgE family curli-type amyloid fiber assembly protein n=1 Tax=Draconibacterium sp. IB214405 TaxID=3097352 RepID=UPI002A0DB656|nr:CsgE family curli-type amyloid fiber assembly protein [Draconibacterium sp. IB214405]MDX8339498.1 CsgE family curli-type amyloid fiber assembly protein [Draconibacterium sp. IB214405]